MKTTFTLFILSLLFLNCTHSGNKKEAEDSLQFYPPTPEVLDRNEFRRYYRELREFFDTTLLNMGFNGGILVARNGAVIYEKYQGLTDIRKKVPLTDSTSLHIASSSKPFTATAVLKLAQEERLSLNDSVTKFFPGFPYPGITVKMLLNHRSGLPNYLYFLSNAKWDKLPASPSLKLQRSKAGLPAEADAKAGKTGKKYAVNQDVLNFLIANKPDKTGSPGSRFNYSNTNYVLLALIIEKVSGKSFPDHMQQEFFGPLQMHHSYVFTLKDTLTATPSFTAKGINWDFDFLDGTYGDKNIYTTPRDLLKWDQALHSNQLISKAFLDSAFSGYSFEKKTIHNYGLGWRMQLLPNGKKVVYHFGKWHGSNAVFARLTDEKVTIIILGNKFTRSIYNAALLCYDIFGDYLQRRVEVEEEIDSVKTDKKTSLPEVKTRKINPPVKAVRKQKQ